MVSLQDGTAEVQAMADGAVALALLGVGAAGQRRLAQLVERIGYLIIKRAEHADDSAALEVRPHARSASTIASG